MNIVTWNCAGALRRKCHLIEEVFEPDIIIVQECEDPARSTQGFQQWAGNHLWFGDNKNKGIGIFDRSGCGLRQLDWDAGDLELFLPCLVGENLTLLAVWTKYANSPNFRYIGQLWKYLQVHKAPLATGPSSMIVGDFNSNTCWDEWDRWWNHSDVVQELSEIGIESYYHRFFNENQGQESRPTLYHRRDIAKPYHVDYIFGPESLLSSCENAVSVGGADKWLEYSDHMPISVRIDR